MSTTQLPPKKSNRTLGCVIALIVGGALTVGGLSIFYLIHAIDLLKVNNPPEIKKPQVDTKKQEIEEALRSAREQYVEKMAEQFRNDGVDAIVSGTGDQLSISSELLANKPNRDQLMRISFPKSQRLILCNMGYRTIYLQGSGLFADGNRYSLGCPETPEEKAARLKSEEEARQQFAKELQDSVRQADVSISNYQVTTIDQKIIIIGPGFASLSPSALKARFGTTANLCDIGVKSIRIETAPGVKYTEFPVHCNSAK